VKRLAWVSALVLFGATAKADDDHSVTASAILGPQLFEHELSPSKTETSSDTFTLSEQLGVQWQWTKLLQPSIALQTNHTDSTTENPSRFTSWQIQPGMAVSIGSPFSLGFDAVVSPRTSGERKLGFGLQPRAGLNAKIGSGLSFVAQVQAPIMLVPKASVSLTPFVGLGYELFGG
jgi:hypothetical protein